MMPLRRFLPRVPACTKDPGCSQRPQRKFEVLVLRSTAEYFYRTFLLIAVLTLCATVASAGTTAHKSRPKHSSAKNTSNAGTSRHHHGIRGRHANRAKAPRGQQVIDNGRAREIQEALIREKYLNGEPSGVWDQRTRDAMARYQADNGWQTKSLPDSRALIKMGLGPNHDNVLNPETAATASPVSAVTGQTESAISRQ